MKKASIKESEIKVAKNPTEALFLRAAENLEKDIAELENSLCVSRAFLAKAKEMAVEARHY